MVIGGLGEGRPTPSKGEKLKVAAINGAGHPVLLIYPQSWATKAQWSFLAAPRSGPAGMVCRD